jgi:hypothetical protein
MSTKGETGEPKQNCCCRHYPKQSKSRKNILASPSSHLPVFCQCHPLIVTSQQPEGGRNLGSKVPYNSQQSRGGQGKDFMDMKREWGLGVGSAQSLMVFFNHWEMF